MKMYNRFSNAKYCPKCHGSSGVRNSRINSNVVGLTRVRRCKNCGYVWKTVEVPYDEFMDAYINGEFGIYQE